MYFNMVSFQCCFVKIKLLFIYFISMTANILNVMWGTHGSLNKWAWNFLLSIKLCELGKIKSNLKMPLPPKLSSMKTTCHDC